MNKNIKEKFETYLQQEKHPDFLAEAKSLAHNTQELEERFADNLEFGTGGLRGIIGVGTNRINPYTVAKISQSLAAYAKSVSQDEICAVVSYDSRRYSKDFATEAAKVFTANGIKTYLFNILHPVPLLSFAVRYYKAQFGVMITASHNPPEYNGYKVYWKDGAQVLPPHDQGITQFISQTDQVHSLSIEDAKDKKLLIMIDKKVDEAYQKAISSLIMRKKTILEQRNKFSIVYTPLHGSGLWPVCQALQGNGFSCFTVQEQESPDGNFPTVKTPNPEDPAALSMAIKLAEKHQSQIVMATDPDADRLGVAVLHKGQFITLTGNQIGAILLKYLATRRIEFGLNSNHPYFVNSIVSSTLHNAIAHAYGIRDYHVLTGFKYVAEKIRTLEESDPCSHFLFGCEESYGYLCTTAVRDKDAVSAALVMAECALWIYTQGHSLIDYLDAIYKEFGYYRETQISTEFPGTSGKKTMQILMEILRKSEKPWSTCPLIEIRDYLTGETIKTGQCKKNIDLPSSNVLEFRFENGCVVIARPSGTEPKIKFYLLGKGKNLNSLEQALTHLQEDIHLLLAEIVP